MRIMLVTKENMGAVSQEIRRSVGIVHHYQYKNNAFNQNFDEDQKNYDCLYSPDPDLLLKLKIKIPYFYDIPSGKFSHDQNFRVFNKHYSQLGGAKAVFVSDKKMCKYANWAELNPFWVSEGISLNEVSVSKKFITPKLHIGYIYDNEEDYKIIKNVFYAKKSNWIFHIYNAPNDLKQEGNIKFYNGDIAKAKKCILDNCHVLLDPNAPYKNAIKTAPSSLSLEAMYNRCIPLSGNINNNEDNILFDKYHYLKLDFIDANTIIETLRYADKRREKLDRMSLAGKKIILKYFNAAELAKRKLNIIRSLI